MGVTKSCQAGLSAGAGPLLVNDVDTPGAYRTEEPQRVGRVRGGSHPVEQELLSLTLASVDPVARPLRFSSLVLTAYMTQVFEQ